MIPGFTRTAAGRRARLRRTSSTFRRITSTEKVGVSRKSGWNPRVGSAGWTRVHGDSLLFTPGGRPLKGREMQSVCKERDGGEQEAGDIGVGEPAPSTAAKGHVRAKRDSPKHRGVSQVCVQVYWRFRERVRAPTPPGRSTLGRSMEVVIRCGGR